MQAAIPLACFLSVIRPPGVQYENSLLQIAPVDKSKCPYVKDGNDVAFQLYTRHNPTVYQELRIDDDERLFASNMDFHDKTVLYFHAWMETPEDGSGVMVREAYMQRGDTNVIMVDARTLEAGPWYFTAAQNTWYIGRFAGQFLDYLVSRGLNLNNTHLVGHSLGAQAAGVAGSALKSGRVARITGLDAALPLFDHLPLSQRLDPTDAQFVDVIHTDAGIFGYKAPMGHVDFYPNAGISPQPGCELEVVIPKQLLLNKCDARAQTNGFYAYYLQSTEKTPLKLNSLEYKLVKLLAFIQSVKKTSKSEKSIVAFDKVKENIDDLYDFKDVIVDYLNDYDDDSSIEIVKDESADGEDLKTTTNIESNNKLISTTDKFTTEDKDLTVDDVIEDLELNDTKLINNPSLLIANERLENKKTTVEDVLDVNDAKDIADVDATLTDQIAEESSVLTEVEINKASFKTRKTRTKRDLDEFKNNIKELTVESGNLTLYKDNITTVLEKVDDSSKNSDKNNTESKNDETRDNSSVNTKREDEYKIDETFQGKKDRKPMKFNLLRPRPVLRQIFRLIPKFKKNSKEKRPFLKFADKIGSKLNPIRKPGAKINPFRKPGPNKAAPKVNPIKLLKRQKRFLPFFQRSEDSNSLLFRMLDFLVKHRKNVLPVFTVMREINTLVRSGNGELNHFSRESNNYIGATPPTFTPTTYNLELGNENRLMAFVKKLFGVIPKGDRLTISDSGK